MQVRLGLWWYRYFGPQEDRSRKESSSFQVSACTYVYLAWVYRKHTSFRISESVSTGLLHSTDEMLCLRRLSKKTWTRDSMEKVFNLCTRRQSKDHHLCSKAIGFVVVHRSQSHVMCDWIFVCRDSILSFHCFHWILTISHHRRPCRCSCCWHSCRLCWQLVQVTE